MSLYPCRRKKRPWEGGSSWHTAEFRCCPSFNIELMFVFGALIWGSLPSSSSVRTHTSRGCRPLLSSHRLSLSETEVVLIFKLRSFETSFINFTCSRHSCLRPTFVNFAACVKTFCNISSFFMFFFFSSSCFNTRILNVRKDSLMETKPLEGEVKEICS